MFSYLFKRDVETIKSVLLVDFAVMLFSVITIILGLSSFKDVSEFIRIAQFFLYVISYIITFITVVVTIPVSLFLLYRRDVSESSILLIDKKHVKIQLLLRIIFILLYLLMIFIVGFMIIMLSGVMGVEFSEVIKAITEITLSSWFFNMAWIMIGVIYIVNFSYMIITPLLLKGKITRTIIGLNILSAFSFFVGLFILVNGSYYYDLNVFNNYTAMQTSTYLIAAVICFIMSYKFITDKIGSGIEL